MDRAELLQAFLEHAEAGHADVWHIERAALVERTGVVLAIRIDRDAVLAREDPPSALSELVPVVEQALTRNGWTLVEHDSALASIVAIEVAGVRAGVWGLWARDEAAARAALVLRAGGAESLLGSEVADRQARVDAELEAIERGLRDDGDDGSAIP